MTETPGDVGGEPPAGRLSVTVGLRGRWITIEADGELDMATAPLLEERSMVALDSSPWIALETSGLTFCDSSRLNVLIRAWRNAAQGGGRLVLVRPLPPGACPADHRPGSATGHDRHPARLTYR